MTDNAGTSTGGRLADKVAFVTGAGAGIGAAMCRAFLAEGEFVRLAGQGMPPERAEFLLDPWNSPYWLRDHCNDDGRVVFIYSFGPNRLRDSNDRRIRDDDVGVVLMDGGRDGEWQFP